MVLYGTLNVNIFNIKYENIYIYNIYNIKRLPAFAPNALDSTVIM